VSDGQIFWYLTRASGLVAYLLMFASVTLGLGMTAGVAAWLRRHRVYDLHRFLSLLTLAVVVFHVFIVLPDGYFGFSLRELLVPFASPYEPFFMALGVLSLYLTAFIIATFYLRPLVPYGAWRFLHGGTFLAFLLALAHGIGAGSDTDMAWTQYIYAASGFVVLALIARRVFGGTARGLKRRAASAVAPAARRSVAP
jgi:predicted ferric reductase